MNLTDRELLELAAKAAELKVDKEWQTQRDLVCNPDKASLWIINGSSGWNPLRNDNDALWLLTTLCFSVIQYTYSVEIMIGNELIHRELFDGTTTRIELTRRAITRAAAAIQLSKEGK